MKYLKLFKTESDYTSTKDSFSYPTVSYTIENREVNMVPIHKRPIKAVFYDSATNSFVKLYPSEITEAIPTYTPIGVEVIPAEHDVYGDGTCGVLSLAEMSCDTPDIGSSEHPGMCWGGYGTDTSLPNYDVVNLVNSTILGYGYLPSDQLTGATSSDGVSKYGPTSDNAPSPFNADGSRNEAYYTTAYSTANALSDFDGMGNTAVLTELATSQSDWKTATTITNSGDAGYYPAACCCWRFHTTGTDQGQWYLPAIGELGYVINRISAINTTINRIKSVYSVVAVAMQTSNYYWSSSECNSIYARNLYTGNGNINYINMKLNSCVRAFLRV